MKNIHEAVNEIIVSLQNIYDFNEASNFAVLLFSHLRGYSRADLHLNSNEKLSINENLFLTDALERLRHSEPIQYVIGECEFMGLIFNVNKNVLIPRPETEELVEWVLDEIKENNLSVLDIGTGSGCIACAIKKYALYSIVEAYDISDMALATAKKNAERNNVKIKFKNVDILNYHLKNEKFDIIVSNPPYITEKEKKFIMPNVLDYEPHLALFVPDNQPFLFYEKIMDFSLKALKPNGKLFFEINEQYGTELVNLLESKGFKNIILKKDIAGRNRMVRGNV